MGTEGYHLGFFDRSSGDERLWQQSVDLMFGAFDWPISREKVKELLLRDTRHAIDPVATYATDAGGNMVGYAGIGRRSVVRDGEALPSANIWTVAVRQDHTRRGLGKALLEMAVERLHSEGIEAITLYTTPGLVAYPIYGSLGFRDHHRLAFYIADAAKEGPGGSTPLHTPELRPLTEGEMARVDGLFDRTFHGMDGFSSREGDHYGAYRAMVDDLSTWFATPDPPGTLEGYVLMGPGTTRGLTTVTEVVGPDVDWYRHAGEAVRAGTAGDRVIVVHRNPMAREGLEAAGFRWWDVHAYQRMMDLGGLIGRDAGEPDPDWFLESRYDVF
jgi:ribosomal protein S18 acetylase RimI-like enzyme